MKIIARKLGGVYLLVQVSRDQGAGRNTAAPIVSGC